MKTGRPWGWGRWTCLVWILFSLDLFVSSRAAAEARVTLKDRVSAQIKDAKKLERVPADEAVPLSLVIHLDEALLKQTLDEIYGPHAPVKKKFLSSAEFAQKFGLINKRKKLKEFALAHGFTVAPDDDKPESMVVKVSGPAGAVENAFGVQLHHFRGADGKKFRSHDTDPSIPASLAPHLSAVLGLSNKEGVYHPYHRISPKPIPMGTNFKAASVLAPPLAMTISGGTGPSGTLAPQDIKTIYGLDQTTLTGAGQTVALFEFDGYAPADIAAYEAAFHLPNVPVTFIGVGGTTNLCGGQNCATQTVDGDGAMAEVALDIEMVAALAPGAQILVYDGANAVQGSFDIFNQMATDNIAQIISTSWGISEYYAGTSLLQAENQIFQRMAAQGQTIFASTGDDGAYGDGSTTNADDPATQPYMTGVGGTTLSGSIQFPTEIAWSKSGGGVSGYWSLPSYQSGVAGMASQQYRNVPDVALNADYPNSPFVISVARDWYPVGGTSASAPLWAAFTALLNQQRLAQSQGLFGFANPTLYAYGTGPNYRTFLKDITGGNNGVYNAGLGYDNATGLGSFKGSAMINPSSALTAAIVNPLALQIIAGHTPVQGIAHGPLAVSYTLDYGAGTSPSVWTPIAQGANTNGQLGIFDPTGLEDGAYVMRLRVTDGVSVVTDTLPLFIQTALITSPEVPLILTSAVEFKKGVVIPILGSAANSGFYMEWAEGINPTSGWSRTGFTLDGTGGHLADWNSNVISQGDYYTLRLSVQNQSVLGQALTLVYVEPDLANTQWPQTINQKPTQEVSVYPQKDGAGHQRLFVSGPTKYWSFASDGSAEFDGPLVSATNWPRAQAAGSFNGGNSDTVIRGEAGKLLQIQPDGTTTPLYSNSGINFDNGTVLMADLFGNSQMEVIASGADARFNSQTIPILHVLNAAGQDMPGFPYTTFDVDPSYGYVYKNHMVAADLDGNGKKELLVGGDTQTGGFDLHLLNPVGTARSFAFTGIDPSVAGTSLYQVAAANLFGDGNIYFILNYLQATSVSPGVFNYDFRILVLDKNGNMMPGWPVAITPPNPDNPGSGYAESASIAIGDLDGDGQDEIVFSGGGLIHVLRSNGTPFSNAWPHVEPDAKFGAVVLGDLDGDGKPEILLTRRKNPPTTYPLLPSSQNPNPAAAYYWEWHLMAYHADGNLMKTWAIQAGSGANRLSYYDAPTPAIGDFDGDGKVGIVLASSFESQYGILPAYSSILKLKLNASYSASATPWPMMFRDPQNSAALITSQAPANQPPTDSACTPAANPCPAQTVILPSGVTLSGIASDDGLPTPPGALTKTWTKVSYTGSGAGTVSFDDSHSLNPTVTFSDAGLYLLRLTADDGVLQATSDITITVNPAPNQSPVASFITTPSPASGNDPLLVSFDGSASHDPDGTIASYDWDFGDGSAHTSGAMAFHTYGPGNFTAKLTVTDNQGAMGSATLPVTVTHINQSPVASFTTTPSPPSGNDPLLVSFDGTASHDPDGTIVSYDWDFGDGSPHAAGTSASHTYSPGNFTATLTVTDNQGASAVSQLPVTVTHNNQLPVASFTTNPSPATGNDPLGVSFDGSASHDAEGPIAAYDWDFGDGSAHTSGAMAFHTYGPGNFTAKLTVTDNNGAMGSAALPVTVTHINQPPVASFTTNPSPASGNEPLFVSFDGSASHDSDGTIASYDWDFGDGSLHGSGATTSHTYGPGSFTAKLIVTDNQGAPGSSTIAVAVTHNNHLPVASFTTNPSPATGNDPLLVTFDGSASSDSDGTIATYDWNFGDGSPHASGPTAAHTYGPGQFTAILTVTDNSGGLANATKPVMVTHINQTPVASFTTNPSPASGNDPLLVTFDGTGSHDPDGTIASYDWDFGDESAHASGITASHMYGPGQFIAMLTVTDNSSGLANATKQVTVTHINQIPVASFTTNPSPASGNDPLLVIFDGAASRDPDGTIAAYDWDFGDGSPHATGVGASHTYGPGNFTAKLTVTDNQGASAVSQRPVAVTHNNQLPVASFTTNPSPANGKDPLLVTFDGTGSHDTDGTITSYDWDFGDGSPHTAGAIASHTYSPGQFTAILTVTDNSNGLANATKQVTVTHINQTPVASFTTNPSQASGNDPLSVSYDGSSSHDPDGTIASYDWDFGDGSAHGSGQKASHTYGPGIFTARLTVTDDKGGTGSISVTVTVHAPLSVLPAPDLSGLDGKTFAVHDSLDIHYSAAVTEFIWEFTPNTSPAEVRSVFSTAGTSALAPIGTKVPHLSLDTLPLTTGRFTLRVQALNGNQSSGWASAAITLVDGDLANVRVRPNPFRAARGDTSVIFDHMTAGSTVKIFVVSGRHVVTLQAPSGIAAWDLTTDTGDKAASGIYLYLVTDGQNNKNRGKFAIIR